MKKIAIVITLGWALAVPSMVLAAETSATTSAVEVGNKICPVSGERAGEMGDIVKVEYEGKIYNLCCAGCTKEFKKDPQKYIDKVNEEMKAGK